jgi:hypothetical protein
MLTRVQRFLIVPGRKHSAVELSKSKTTQILANSSKIFDEYFIDNEPAVHTRVWWCQPV